MKSLLRKAAEEGVAPGAIAVAEPAERDLALVLDAFDHAAGRGLRQAARRNLLAEHAYRLAQTFSKFYAACPVLTRRRRRCAPRAWPWPPRRLRQLELALDLLGIATPERM